MKDPMNRNSNAIASAYEEDSYTIPNEACCSPEFPEGCIFNEEE